MRTRQGGIAEQLGKVYSLDTSSIESDEIDLLERINIASETIKTLSSPSEIKGDYNRRQEIIYK